MKCKNCGKELVEVSGSYECLKCHRVYTEEELESMKTDKHKITFIFSGSWKVDEIIEDGDTEHGRPYNQKTREFEEAECSCGKFFNSFQEAYEHKEKVKEKQQYQMYKEAKREKDEEPLSMEQWRKVRTIDVTPSS